MILFIMPAQHIVVLHGKEAEPNLVKLRHEFFEMRLTW